MKTGEKREILKEGGRKERGERQIRRNGYIVFAQLARTVVYHKDMATHCKVQSSQKTTGQQTAQTQRPQTLLEPMHPCQGLLRQTLGRLCQRRETAFAPINRRKGGGGERERKQEERRKERTKRERDSGHCILSEHYQLLLAYLHDSCNLLPLVSAGVYASRVVSTAVQQDYAAFGSFLHGRESWFNQTAMTRETMCNIVTVTATRRMPLSFIT